MLNLNYKNRRIDLFTNKQKICWLTSKWIWDTSIFSSIFPKQYVSLFVYSRVLKELWTWNCSKNQNKNYPKQIQFQVRESYKTRETTLFCIGNSEENIELSQIYLSSCMRVHCACQQSCISKIYLKGLWSTDLFSFFFSKKLTSKNYFFRFHTDGFHPNAVHFADLKEEDILWHYLNTKSVTHMHRIMYELITCFHEFCNYESMIFFTKSYLFIFLRGRTFWLRSNYGKKANVLKSGTLLSTTPKIGTDQGVPLLFTKKSDVGVALFF